MASTYLVLGQSNPLATTLTDLYTVPGATSAVVSTITVANLASAAATYRLAVRVAGAAIAPEQYLVYDATLAANTTQTMTLGITLEASDVLSVYASTANVAFNAFGSEVS